MKGLNWLLGFKVFLFLSSLTEAHLCGWRSNRVVNPLWHEKGFTQTHTCTHKRRAHTGLCLQWKARRHGISFHIQLRPKKLGEKSVEISCKRTQHSHSNICANITHTHTHTAVVNKRTTTLHKETSAVHTTTTPPTHRQTHTCVFVGVNRQEFGVITVWSLSSIRLASTGFYEPPLKRLHLLPNARLHTQERKCDASFYNQYYFPKTNAFEDANSSWFFWKQADDKCRRHKNKKPKGVRGHQFIPILQTAFPSNPHLSCLPW